MAGDFLSAEFLGLGALHDALAQLGEHADAAGKAIVAEGAALVEAAAKANFQGSHAKGAPHVGGDRPNVVTGTARRSIRTDVATRVGRGEWTTQVAPRVVYGRRLELGYLGSRGYPYFVPAVRTVEPQLAALQARIYRQFMH